MNNKPNSVYLHILNTKHNDKPNYWHHKTNESEQTLALSYKLALCILVSPPETIVVTELSTVATASYPSHQDFVRSRRLQSRGQPLRGETGRIHLSGSLQTALSVRRAVSHAAVSYSSGCTGWSVGMG